MIQLQITKLQDIAYKLLLNIVSQFYNRNLTYAALSVQCSSISQCVPDRTRMDDHDYPFLLLNWKVKNMTQRYYDTIVRQSTHTKIQAIIIKFHIL